MCQTYHNLCSTEETFLQQFFGNSEANASGLLKNLEEMFLDRRVWIMDKWL